MWFRSILDYLTSASRTPAPTLRRNSNRSRNDTRRLIAEALEERCLMTLSPAVGYAALANPLDAVVGDFNGDGHHDLATINASQLSVVHGNGDGTFDAPQTTTIGSGFAGLAAADFNGDGRLDLAATASKWNGTAWQGSVNLLLNNGNDLNGNATFQAARSFSTGTNLFPNAVAVGDLNGDGKADVAAAQSNGSNVTVLLGNGDGTLKTGLQYAVGSSPGSVAVGDFNGDTKLDLVTANRGSNTVSLLLNNGAAGNVSFQPARNSAIAGNVQSVAVGDFDHNGKLDLVATSNVVASVYWGYYSTYYDYDGYVNVLLGDGTGTFAAPKATWTSYNELGDVTVGDLNNDGNLDVVTADGFVQQYVDPTVLLGRGDGAFDAPYFFEAGAGPYSVMVADFNGDSAPDVATANYYASSVSVLLNDANWLPVGTPFVSIGGSPTVMEGNDGTATLAFTVSLTAPSERIIQVDFHTADGTALAGADYEAKTGSVIFAAGQTSQTIEVSVIGDRLTEWDEYFFVALSNPSNVRMGNTLAAGYIRDDEPRISIDYGPVYVTEGNTGSTNAVFTVRLSAAYDAPVSVNVSTAEGDTEWWYYGYYGYYQAPPAGTAGSDFEAVTSRTITFDIGETVKTIPIAIYGDRIGEYDEYFSVNLSDPAGGVINSAHAVGVIVNDEPIASINSASVTEGNTGTTALTFTVTLSAAPTAPVTVTYATADGSATIAGGDYQAKTATLTFGIGETSKTFTVLVNGDRLAEYDETFYVNLTSATGALISYNATGYGTIMDNEPRLSINSASVKEGNSGTKLMTFTVTLSAAYDQAVTVNYATQDGSATVSGGDYVAKSGSLSFSPGQTTKTFTVTIKGDTKKESDEYFYVLLQGASSNALISNAYGWGDILSDDGRKH